MKFGEVRRNSAKFDNHRTEALFMYLILKEIGSSGRTRTYNPSVNSRIVMLGVHMFSTEYEGGIGAIGASKAHNSAKNSAKFCNVRKAIALLSAE
jgi:hypothetical protein